MNRTTNYQLGKPLEDEIYDISVQNSNMDIIDAALKSASDTAEDASSGLASHTANKSNPHGVTKSQVGLSNVPNVTTNNQTPTYSVPSTEASLTSGETLQIAMGKIAKAVSSLISHLANVGNPHSVTKTQIGLGNVPNVSTNDQTPTYSDTTTLVTLSSGEKLNVALQKIKLAITTLINHIANVSNPHSVTKAQVGLGNVNNTSDANKPVSTATQAAIDAVSGIIDGYEANGQLGSPKIVTVTGENLNNYVTAGVYCFAAGYVPTNNPPGNTNGWLIVIPWQASGGTCKQIWLRHGTFGSTDHHLYIRTKIGSEWSAWYEIITDKSQLVYGLGVPNGTITENSNLNNYKTPGIYNALGTGIGSTITNTPTTLNFKLVVENLNTDSFIYQTVISRIGKKWTRYFDGNENTWSEWIVAYCNNVKEMTLNSNGKLVVTRTDGTVATFAPETLTS